MAGIFTTLSISIRLEEAGGSQNGIITLDWRENIPGRDPWNTMFLVFGAGDGEWSALYSARRVQLYGTLPGQNSESWLATLDHFSNPRNLRIGSSGAGLWYPTSTPMPNGVIGWEVTDII